MAIRLESEHIGVSVGLHCLFATASPILTNEIHRYYRTLTSHIKAELDKKWERLKQKEKEMEKQKAQQSEVVEVIQISETSP